MPNRVKRTFKRIKELAKNPAYVASEGAKLVNSLYDTLPMEVALKKGGKIKNKKKKIKFNKKGLPLPVPKGVNKQIDMLLNPKVFKKGGKIW